MMIKQAPASAEHAPRTKHRRSVLVLLVAFVLLSTLYNSIVPLGEGPDEPGHFAYALFLAREGRLPVQRLPAAQSDVPGEGHQPPLAYLLMLPTVTWLPAAERRLVVVANPHFRWNGGDEAAAFVRGSREYWPWNGVALAWHLARGVSTLLGAATVLFVYLAAREVNLRPSMGDVELNDRQANSDKPHTTSALLAAALVAFNPQFLFSSALVTNDLLLTALSAALFWRCLAARPADRNAVSALQYGHVALMGLLFGLALMTKQSALLLGPLLLWASWRVAGGHWRRMLAAVAVWGGVALLSAGWWYLRNWQLYGDPFGLELFQAKFTTQAFTWQSLTAWGGALAQVFTSFWAYFGWISLQAPAWVHWFYGGLCLLALLGYCKKWVANVRWNAHAQPKIQKLKSKIAAPWFGVVLLPLLAFAWTVSFALTAGLVAWQGRMLFPALPALGIGLAGGLEALIRPSSVVRRPQMALSFLLMTFYGAMAAYLPFAVIAPAYAWRVLPPATAQARIEMPFYARYAQSWEQGAELRGWRVQTSATEPNPRGLLRAGQTLTLTLTWHALEPIPRNWTVFVHVVDAAEQIVAESNTLPQDGSLPMPLWTPGDWLEDTHTLVLPRELPPGRYAVRVGLFLPQDRWQRQGVWAEDGAFVGDYAELGTLDAP